MKLTTDLVRSITTTLTTRLAILSSGDDPAVAFLGGGEIRLTLSPKTLAAIIDELARNTAQLVVPMRERLDESTAWLTEAIEIIARHQREFATADEQSKLEDLRDFARRTRLYHLDQIA